VERLDQVVVGARPQPADLLLDLPLGGQHDDRDVAGLAFLRPDLRRDLVPVELGQHHVEEDQVGLLGAPEAEPLGAVARDDDLVAFLLQRVLKQALNVRVVDDEDLGHAYPRTTWPPRAPWPCPRTGDGPDELGELRWNDELRRRARTQRLERLEVLQRHRLLVDSRRGVEDPGQGLAEALRPEDRRLALTLGLEDLRLLLALGVVDRSGCPLTR
jgi:hypothetical protein